MSSLYVNPDYKEVPFAKMTLESILSADPNNPTVDPVPYVGIQFAADSGVCRYRHEVEPGVLRPPTPGSKRWKKRWPKPRLSTTDEMEAAGYR